MSVVGVQEVGGRHVGRRAFRVDLSLRLAITAGAESRAVRERTRTCGVLAARVAPPVVAVLGHRAISGIELPCGGDAPVAAGILTSGPGGQRGRQVVSVERPKDVDRHAGWVLAGLRSPKLLDCRLLASRHAVVVLEVSARDALADIRASELRPIPRVEIALLPKLADRLWDRERIRLCLFEVGCQPRVVGIARRRCLSRLVGHARKSRGDDRADLVRHLIDLVRYPGGRKGDVARSVVARCGVEHHREQHERDKRFESSFPRVPPPVLHVAPHRQRSDRDDDPSQQHRVTDDRFRDGVADLVRRRAGGPHDVEPGCHLDDPEQHEPNETGEVEEELREPHHRRGKRVSEAVVRVERGEQPAPCREPVVRVHGHRPRSCGRPRLAGAAALGPAGRIASESGGGSKRVAAVMPGRPELTGCVALDSARFERALPR